MIFERPDAYDLRMTPIALLLTREPEKIDTQELRISAALPLVPVFHLRWPLICFLTQLNSGCDNNSADAGTFYYC